MFVEEKGVKMTKEGCVSLGGETDELCARTVGFVPA